MAEGKPFSYLQVSTIWTQDYQEKIQLVARVGLEPGAQSQRHNR